MSEESLKFLLMLLRQVRVIQVLDHLCANLRRQLHIFHRGIGRVDLLLEAGSFLVQVIDDQRHVTKNVRINQRTHNDGRCRSKNLECSKWQHVVTRHLQDSNVN